ncbi:aldolase [Deferribacterales bacterium RsTz2092]|nr:aldolase [Deferribacterales bacterium]
MSNTHLKDKICEIGKRLYDKGLLVAYDGNISARISDEVWTTPSGVCKGYLTPEMLVCTDLSGKVLVGDNPSSELKMHLMVYAKSNALAVVHSHPPYATAYASAHIALNRYILVETITSLGVVPLAEYATPSTDEVPASIAPLIAGHKAILLANHGALSWGTSLDEAYFTMESLELSAKTQFLAHLLGRGKDIPDEKVSFLKELLARK